MSSVNRRRLLSAIGITSVALPAGALATGRPAWATATNVIALTLADLRGITSPDADTLYYLTDPRIEGPFRYLPGDVTSAESLGTLIVGAAGARYQRILLDNEIDVRWFGAIGDGANHPLSQRYSTLAAAQAIYPHATALTDEIDWCAIQAALNTVKAANTITKAVRVPQGDYVINQALRAEIDDLQLRGLGAASISIEMDYFGLMVNRGSNGGEGNPQPVHNVHVRDLTFRAMKGYGPTNGGVIIFNNCIDLVLDNVAIIGDAAQLTARQRLTNGIGTSQGTSGVLRNCLVDGVAKPGFYIANGSKNLRLEACEARNMSGSLGFTPGFAVSGADNIMFIGCSGHHNQGAGLQITCDGYPAPEGTPSTNIQVIGGQYSHNRGNGILMGTNIIPQFARDVQLIGVDTSDNELNGFLTGAAHRLVLADHTARNNKGSGIAVVNYFAITDSVEISNPQVSNNGVAGVEIRAVDRICVNGGRAFDDQATKTQVYGLSSVPIAGKPAPSNVRILDLETFGNKTAAHNFTGAEAASGYFRLTGTGTPEGNVAAPPGSEYGDLIAGAKYIKVTGTSKTGWKQILTSP